MKAISNFNGRRPEGIGTRNLLGRRDEELAINYIFPAKSQFGLKGPKPQIITWLLSVSCLVGESSSVSVISLFTIRFAITTLLLINHGVKAILMTPILIISEDC